MAKNDCMLESPRHCEDSGPGKPCEDRSAAVSRCFSVGKANEGSTAVKTDDSLDLETGKVNWGPDKKQDE